MKVLNFGSLNLDYVYQVDRFVRPGETLSARSMALNPGGKGLNQSIALARAGAQVYHGGCVGKGGEALRELLRENGVNTELLLPTGQPQGSAVIQVTPQGENCILLYGGSNQALEEGQYSGILESEEGFSILCRLTAEGETLAGEAFDRLLQEAAEGALVQTASAYDRLDAETFDKALTELRERGK